MDALQRILLFRDVVDLGSFAAAGRRWDCSHSTVSRQVQALERDLSVRLLHRTTRSMALTHQGSIVYASAQRMDLALNHMRDRLDEARGAISGELRVASLVHLARHLVVPAIANCVAEHPQLRIHLAVDDGPLDLARDQPDAAVRVGFEADGLLSATEILTNAVCLVATPTLLARLPELRHPQQLANVPTVAYVSSADSITSWRYHAGDTIEAVTVDPILRVGDGNVLADAIAAGVGIGYVSAFAVRDQLASGALVQVLPAWSLPPYAPVTLLTPAGEQRSPRVEAFAQHLSAVAQRLAD